MAPGYSAREHNRAAERMVMDMEKNTHTKYEIRADNPDPTKAEEWAIFATDYNCHARRIACTTNKAEADAMLRGLSGDDPDLLAACEEALCLEDSSLSTWDCTYEGNRMYAVNPFVLERVVNAARAAIAKAKGGVA
jgi:hypothetical protein